MKNISKIASSLLVFALAMPQSSFAAPSQVSDTPELRLFESVIAAAGAPMEGSKDLAKFSDRLKPAIQEYAQTVDPDEKVVMSQMKEAAVELGVDSANFESALQQFASELALDPSPDSKTLNKMMVSVFAGMKTRSGAEFSSMSQCALPFGVLAAAVGFIAWGAVVANETQHASSAAAGLVLGGVLMGIMSGVMISDANCGE